MDCFKFVLYYLQNCMEIDDKENISNIFLLCYAPTLLIGGMKFFRRKIESSITKIQGIQGIEQGFLKMS